MPDHAEEVFKTYAHDPGKFTFNMTQIPFLIWFSQEYKDKYLDKYENILKNSNKYFSNDRLYDTLLGFTDVKTALYKNNFDLTSDKYSLNEQEASTLHGKVKFSRNDNYFYWQRKNFDYLLQTNINDKFIVNNINSLGKLKDALYFGFKSFGLKLALVDKKLVTVDNKSLSFEDILSNINLEKINKIYIDVQNNKNISKEIDNLSSKYDIKSKLILNNSEIVKLKASIDNKSFIKEIKTTI